MAQSANAFNHSFTSRKRIRKNFGTMLSATSLPNLIEVQKNSYEQFLQMYVPVKDRKNTGLHAVLKSVFPIKDFADTSTLEYVRYEFDRPKYDVDECRQRGINFAAPLRVTLRLIVWLVDADTGAREIKDIKEQDVYMGDIPLMTENGTFTINGTERVIVSQMHRSPGVFFDHDHGKTHSSGKFLYSARIIPYRGSWLDFEFDAKDIVHVRIDRRRKLPATTILRALGMDNQQILNTFYATRTIKSSKKGWTATFDAERMEGPETGVRPGGCENR
jgi:DNA-directed RNA polymerase subunit beta